VIDGAHDFRCAERFAVGIREVGGAVQGFRTLSFEIHQRQEAFGAACTGDVFYSHTEAGHLVGGQVDPFLVGVILADVA
jgi:hypothetical protein